MRNNFFIRTNGRANAWPVFMGQSHPVYTKEGKHEIANASFSLLSINDSSFNLKKIDWEIVVDAGHGTSDMILNNENRIPEAIVITHPHLDHTLGIDWIAQSYYYTNNIYIVK